jgi:hypothetical protein
MTDPIELQRSLSQFTGTQTWYRHGLNRNMLYTDGVQYFAEHAGGGAYWFLDIVATELFALQRQYGFISITIDARDNKAKLAAKGTDLAGEDVWIWGRNIDYTDCPAGEWKFFFCSDVLMLPSEY